MNIQLSHRVLRRLVRSLSLIVLGWISLAQGAGYTASITTAYPQLSINANATQLTWASCNSFTGSSAYLTCDDGVTTIMPIGFTFSYAGVNYTNWSMSSNGVIFFETSSSGNSTGGSNYVPQNLPTTVFGGSFGPPSTVKPALMPFWADLQKNASVAGANNAGQPTNASFYQYEVQTLPSGVQVLVIQLKNVQYWSSSPTLYVNLQVQLWSTGEIVYSYGAMQAMTSNPSLRIGLQYPGAANGCNTLANSQSTSLSNESFVYKWDTAASGCTTITTPDHYEIRHDGAATLCAEPVTALACSVGTTPCPTASIINTQIITAQLSITGTGVTNVTQSPASFNIQPSTPLPTVNLTWASGSSGTATLNISPSVAPIFTTVCTNLAGTLSTSCNMAVSNTTCIPPPHHYQILGPVSSSTCSEERFTIKAWANAAETTAYTTGVATGNLTTSINPAAIPNLGAFTIPAGSSTVNISPITFPTAGTTKFSTSATPALSGATTCNFGGATSCSLAVATCAPDALYRFDEGNWSGAASEVKDSSGNARHASLYKNDAGAVVAKYPTLTMSPDGKKCNAAYFAPQATPAVMSSVNTPIVLGSRGTIHFWYKSDQPWMRSGAKSVELFDASGTRSNGTPSPFFLAKTDGGTILFMAETIEKNYISASTAVYDFPAGEWHHIAVAWDLLAGENSLLFYVDGVLDTSGSSINTATAGRWGPLQAPNTLQIGDYSLWAPYSIPDGASGIIDEFYYYPYVISRAQIIADRDSSAPATCALGLHHIQIEHTSGTGLTCTPSTVTLKACADATCSSLYKGGVTGTMSATGGTANWVGGTGFSIDNTGSVTKNVQVTTTSVATLGASVTTPAGVSNATTCLFGTATDCKFTAAAAGFIFDVPNHVADVSQSVNVSAVKQSDSSLACTPAFASASKTVNFNCSYTNPGSGTKPVTVGSTDITCGTARGVSLSFDATGKAATTVRYADVGNVSLTASYSGASATAEAGLVMSGSDSFIAAPKDFAVAASGSPYVAGKTFSATVTARNNSGTTTPNFGKETTPEGATLSFSRCQPTGTGTSEGTFSGTLGSFASGAASGTDLKWSEVGNGDVVATLTSSDYLTSGVTAATGNTGSSGTTCNTAGTVGPFKPAYFDTIVTSGCSAFTYAGLTGTLAGQPFSVKVKAKRSGGDSTDATNTVNYAGATWARAVTLSDAAAGTAGTLTNTGLAATAFSAGVASRSDVTYTFSNKLTSPYTLAIRAVDADAVSSSGHAEGSTEERSGRLRLSNAYGSVSPVYMAVEAQYWSGLAWVKNTADSCSTTTGSSPQVTFAVAPASTGWTLTPGSFAGGQMGAAAALGPTGLKLDRAPPASTTITASVPAWLQWTWGGVASPVAPSANASVGIYGTGESRKTVHIRELY